MIRRISAIAFGVALVATGWFGRQLLPTRTAVRTEGDELPLTIRTDVAKAVAFNPPTEYVGHVEPAETTDILPQIDGYIRKVCFTEGAKVSAGDLLFEIDDEQYIASRNLRYSEVRSAEAKVLVAKSAVEQAERYFRRKAGLKKGAYRCGATPLRFLGEVHPPLEALAGRSHRPASFEMMIDMGKTNEI